MTNAVLRKSRLTWPREQSPWVWKKATHLSWCFWQSGGGWGVGDGREAVSPSSASCRCGSKSVAEKAKNFWNHVGEPLGKQVLRYCWWEKVALVALKNNWSQLLNFKGTQPLTQQSQVWEFILRTSTSSTHTYPRWYRHKLKHYSSL